MKIESIYEAFEDYFDNHSKGGITRESFKDFLAKYPNLKEVTSNVLGRLELIQKQFDVSVICTENFKTSAESRSVQYTLENILIVFDQISYRNLVALDYQSENKGVEIVFFKDVMFAPLPNIAEGKKQSHFESPQWGVKPLYDNYSLILLDAHSEEISIVYASGIIEKISENLISKVTPLLKEMEKEDEVEG